MVPIRSGLSTRLRPGWWLELRSARCSRVRFPGGAVLNCWGGSASRKGARKRVVVTSDDHFLQRPRKGLTGHHREEMSIACSDVADCPIHPHFSYGIAPIAFCSPVSFPVYGYDAPANPAPCERGLCAPHSRAVAAPEQPVAPCMIFLARISCSYGWEVEYTDEFGQWWQTLSEGQQDAVAARVELLMEHGPNLPYPFSSDIRSSRHGVMRELRAPAGPCGSSTPSTPGARPYSSSAATRRATTGSTRSTCRWPTTSTTSIWTNCEGRE